MSIWKNVQGTGGCVTFPELDRIHHFTHLITLRQPPGAPVEESNARVLAGRGIEPSAAVFLRQVHSDTTVTVASIEELPEDDRKAGPADGIIAAKPGLFPVIRTADCVPVVAVAPRAQMVALFHAGWRGTRSRIVEKGLAEFLRVARTPQDDILLAIGPCIRKCCYEVGSDVRAEFAAAGWGPACFTADGRLDLVEATRIQANRCGVERVLDCGLCTSCRNDLFYSYRREGTAHRNWTVAGFSR